VPLPLFRIAHLLIDLVLCLGVYVVVYLLRFEGHIPPTEMPSFWFCLVLLPVLRLGANYTQGVYSHIWKYTGMRELFSLFRAVLLGSFLFVLVTYLMGLTGFPRSIFALEAAFYFLAVGGVRFSRRFSREINLAGRGTQFQRTLIVGAGDAGAMVASEMLRDVRQGFVPMGFIDDDRSKWKARIHGLRVFGGRERLAEVVIGREVDAVIIAMPSVPRSVIRDYVDLCKPLGIQLQIVPATYQILRGDVRMDQLRQIQIEDLLGRNPVKTDDTEVKRLIQGKKVLVTGAGGSIGSELCRQILSYHPAALYLLGHGENSIYQLEQELRSGSVKPIIADIRHRTQLDSIFQELQPDLLFHAAAHKHVPLMEQNLYESFLNNVYGSYCVLSAAQKSGIQRAVLISTDKSTHPSSIMGLSKYFAELVVHRLAAAGTPGQLAVVRFGNVIGSRGSVIPLFQRQIAQGGPLTLTDRAMTRYFMTIPEAVQLVLQASVLAAHNPIFILDMGEPVRIEELARNMIQLSGYQADEIEIRVTGLRPGEKLHETLVWEDEALKPSSSPQVLAATPDQERLSAHQNLLAQMLPLLETADRKGFESLYQQQILPCFNLMPTWQQSVQ
jgi:FlaA1/EpsC-like NDP-sugar epimerase